MTIIEMHANENGQHRIESQSYRKVCWLEGYIEVPASLEASVWKSLGWCKLTIEDGKLVCITPTEHSFSEEPSNQEQIAELKAELDATDYKIIKCSECQLAGLELPYDVAALHAERQAIRDQINALEAEVGAEESE